MQYKIPLQKLAFSFKYLFSNEAKDTVKKLDLDLNSLPENVKNRAFLRVSNAVNNKPYLQEHIVNSEDFLKEEVLAFPVSKIIISFMKEDDLQKFCKSLAESTFYYLEKEKNKQQTLLDLAADLNLKMDLLSEEKLSNKNFTVKLSLLEFLFSLSFFEKNLALVNLPVENGFVFLNENHFARFLAQKAYSITMQSLPVNTKEVPHELKQLAFSVKKDFEAKIDNELLKSAGKISPSMFPDCMKAMYSSLLKGEKLSHMANFSLAAFLSSIGLGVEEILALYKKQPNFNERISRYHIERIVGTKGQGYKAPNCEKIRAYGLCPNANCNSRNPVSFYKRELFALKKQKEVAKKAETKVMRKGEANA